MTTWTWCAYSASGRTSQRYSLKGWIEQPSSECDVHGSNESDTRAKLIEPALHSVRRVENGDDADRPSHDEIRREQSAVRIEIVDGNPIKRCRRRVDYLLHAFVGDDEQPLTPAFVEVKKEARLPTHRLEQVKVNARRLAVKFVYSTNGNTFVEFDTRTGQTSDPRPMAQFALPEELRQRRFTASAISVPVFLQRYNANQASS